MDKNKETKPVTDEEKTEANCPSPEEKAKPAEKVTSKEENEKKSKPRWSR